MIALLPLTFVLFNYTLASIQRSVLEISKWEEKSRAHGLISSPDGKKKTLKKKKTVTTETTAAPKVMM